MNVLHNAIDELARNVHWKPGSQLFAYVLGRETSNKKMNYVRGKCTVTYLALEDWMRIGQIF